MIFVNQAKSIHQCARPNERRKAVLAEERQARILEVLSESENGILAVSALSELFGVSGMTIRVSRRR